MALKLTIKSTSSNLAQLDNINDCQAVYKLSHYPNDVDNNALTI